VPYQANLLNEGVIISWSAVLLSDCAARALPTGESTPKGPPSWQSSTLSFNGMVVCGTRVCPYEADMGIKNGKIAKIVIVV
jgi:hypothetical protein